MKFARLLEASMLPEWQPYYIHYKALKKKLKEAGAEHASAVDLLAASPQTTSLSIARSFASGSPRHLVQQQPQLQPSSNTGDGPVQQQQPVFFAPYGLEEQFLQMLQQDLANVGDFIVTQAATLSAALESLAAAAPKQAVQDTEALEAAAQRLGQQLLALEQFVNINQKGFVKIVKKHDKLHPDCPVWHLYLHHLQKTPWLQEQQRHFMWAALSSCYYHLHASILASSRQRGRKQQQQHRDDKSQLSSRTASVTDDNVSRGYVAASMAASTANKFLPLELGAAVAGAATAAVAGAVTAVAGVATAVAGAAAAASRPGTAAAGTKVLSPPAVNFTKKFWVAQEDVSAVIYKILQHLPVLPSAACSSAGGSTQQQAGFGTRQRAAAAANPWQQQQQQPTQQQQQQQLAGFTTTLHTVYFDNKGLELYHGRLYFRPNTQTLKARWIGHDDGTCWAPAKIVLERKVYREGWKGEKNIKDALLIAGEVFPAYLVGTYSLGDALSQLYELPALQNTLQQTLSSLQQRRQQRQAAAQQKLLQLQQQSPFAAAAGPAGSSGNGPAADATADAEVNAALAAAGVRIPPGVVLGASFSVNSTGGVGILAKSYNTQQDAALQQEQQEQQHQQQQQQADSEGRQQQQQQQQDSNMGLPQSSMQQQQNSDMQGLQLLQQQEMPMYKHLSQAQLQQQQQQHLNNAGHNRSFSAATTFSLADSSDDDESGSEDNEQYNSSSHTAHGRQQHNSGPLAAAADASSSSAADPFTDGFEDAYLDPPVPTADQLSLFAEVQRLVARKRLRPVLHCILQRMLFAMPFDERIKITLDTDVAISAVAHYQLLQDSVQAAAVPAAGEAPVGLGQPAAAVRQPSISLQQSAAEVQQQVHDSQHAPEPGIEQNGLRALSALSLQLQEQQQQQQQLGTTIAVTSGAAAERAFGIFDMPFNPAMLEQEDQAYDTWEAIYSAADCCKDDRHSSSGNTDLTYGMPYALLKVSVDLPAGQNPPGWLLQLMDSEMLSPVEDWSKFVHGCAVLLPEAVRAVPYWIDDPLVGASIQATQAELDAAIFKREEQLKLAAMAASGPERARSAPSASQHSIGGSSFGRLSGSLARSSSGGVSSGFPQGMASPESHSGAGSQQSSAGGALPQQRQQQLWRQRSGRISRSRHSSSSSTGGLHQLEQQQESEVAISAGTVHSSGVPHRVTWAGDSPAHSQVQQLQQLTAGGTRSSSAHPDEPASPPAAVRSKQQQFRAGSEASTPCGSFVSSTAAVPVEDGVLSSRHILRRLSSLVQQRPKPPPLFRPEGCIQRGWRKRWGHPVQLLECREFFYSEAMFLEWLRLAITMASVAVLLLGYSAMAYVNPLKRPMIHVAEIITLLMLPSSCIMVAYAIGVYIWRGKRLHSMRYRRVDDQLGPNLMTAVFVTAMVAIFLVNVADLLLILKSKSKQQGDDPESGGEPELAWLFTRPYVLLQHLCFNF